MDAAMSWCVPAAAASWPVTATGVLRGVEAVIDKDLTSSLLAAARRGSSCCLTDVDHVIRDHGGANPQPIREGTVAELRELEWAAGSMGPKIEAACRFVERTGRPARIGGLEHAGEVLAGRSGTKVG
jgi:carbamate kinase